MSSPLGQLSANSSSLTTDDHSRGLRPAERRARPTVELVAAAVEHVAVEADQEAHLIRERRSSRSKNV